jgi:hypothetical protein
MSDSFTQKLSRFTPDASGLDRAALLFAAGRASARPNRPWIALAGTLAAAQVLTLVLLWPRTLPPSGTPELVDTAPPVKAEPVAPEVKETPSPYSIWALQQRILQKDNKVAPTNEIDEMIPSAPPLRAFPISADGVPN